MNVLRFTEMNYLVVCHRYFYAWNPIHEFLLQHVWPSESSPLIPAPISFHYHGIIAPDYPFRGPLHDWKITMNFSAPLAKDLKVWVAEGHQKSTGKSSVTLTPKSWNQKIWKRFQLSYIAAFERPQMKHLECVEFCGKLNTGEDICSGITPVTTKRPPSTPRPPSTRRPPSTSRRSSTPKPKPSSNCYDVLRIDGSQDYTNGGG